jgi:hypothetical protein
MSNLLQYRVHGGNRFVTSIVHPPAKSSIRPKSPIKKPVRGQPRTTPTQHVIKSNRLAETAPDVLDDFSDALELPSPFGIDNARFAIGTANNVTVACSPIPSVQRKERVLHRTIEGRKIDFLMEVDSKRWSIQTLGEE